MPNFFTEQAERNGENVLQYNYYKLTQTLKVYRPETLLITVIRYFS